MQRDFRSVPPFRRPMRLIKDSRLYGDDGRAGIDSSSDVASQPTQEMKPVPSTEQSTSPFTIRRMITSLPTRDFFELEDTKEHLMQLSGMMRVVRVPKTDGISNERSTNMRGLGGLEEEWWPNGIQQTGVLPIVNLYGSEPFGRSLPRIAATPVPAAFPVMPVEEKQPSGLKALLSTPFVRVMLGLFIGIGLLVLISRFVNISVTLTILRANLVTPRGLLFTFLSGVAFLTAFSIRGIRWKLFLNTAGNISTFKAIQLFLVGVFMNFLLPISGGEVAKSLMLKRIAGIPISKSLPTVAMDRSLDLMPALVIMAIVPFLGVQMDIKLWFILAFVSGLLIGLVFFIILAAWKRTAAIALMQRITRILPGRIGGKIEGFATGFVDSLLAGASQPKIFLPAILLTCLAVMCDALFAMFAFWTIGFPVSFGTALFGYTVYNLFYILPTPPGQVGSNELIGLLVFTGLLHLPADKVTAMFVFSHPWAALLMTVTGFIFLNALGLTITSAMKVQTEGEKAKESGVPPQMKHQVAGV